MIRSKVTARSQTTIPRGVREALEIEPGDELTYEIRSGYAILRPVKSAAREDAALAPFLDLLARDVADRPEALVPVPEELVERARRLTSDIVGDENDAIEGPVAL